MTEIDPRESPFVSLRDEQASKQASGAGGSGGPPRAGARQARARGLIITTLFALTQRVADLGPRVEDKERPRNVFRDGPAALSELGLRLQDKERALPFRAYTASVGMLCTVAGMTVSGVLGRVSGMPAGATASEVAIRGRSDELGRALQFWLLAVLVPATALLAGAVTVLQSLGGFVLVMVLGVVLWATWGTPTVPINLGVSSWNG